MRSLNPQTSTRNLRPPAATARVPAVTTTPPPPGQPSRPPSRASKTPTPSLAATLASDHPLVAKRRPRPASALVADGRPRHSTSSPSLSQRRRPVTATATISTPSSRQSALSRTSQTPNHASGPPPPHLATTAAPITVSTPTSTCSTSSKRFSLLRAPFLSRDHNASGGDMTRPTKTFTATMAPDKGGPPGANSRQPPLAPTVAKSLVGRAAPRTPKVATPPAQPRIAQPTVATGQPRVAQPAATTPLARRTTHQQGTGPTKDEYASPVSSFFNNNITPRSGSRQSRVDSNNNSPCGTPAPETGDGWDPRFGLALSALDGDPARKAGPFGPAGEAARDGQAAGPVESKFFFASDAKGAQPKQPAAPPPRPGGNFFYANGGAVENKQNGHALPPGMRSASPSLAPALGHAPEGRSSKFIYANGIPDLSPGQSQAGPARPLSAVSTTSRMTTGRMNQGSQPSSIPYIQRPASPVKMGSHPALSSHWSSAQPFPASSRSPNTLAQSALPPSFTARRKSSIESTSQKAHSRSGSLSNAALIVESPPLSKGLPSIPSSEVSSPSGFSSPIMTLASPLQPVEERFAEAESSLEAAAYGELHSPTKAAHPDDQLSELIANARRDRKVQDLEITVTSLSAINRSLERRLRKQAVELRRYRRLSRAGRLSLTSTASTIHSESLASEAGTEGFDLSDLSEEEPEEESEEESDTETDSGSETLSPEARAARDARHREKDERRLELDLSRHREQLIDSQKINQSLKRCLNWTEELISEGSRALAYQVHVNDVKLGGRVLVPEDEDDEDDDGLADSDHGDDTMNDLSIVTEDDDSPWAKEAQVRNGGLQFPPEGG